MIQEISFTTGAVTSRDGTKIGYRQAGHGPGIALVQGAMGTAYNYDQLATDLANDFTVDVLDRRGRGMSPRKYGTEHSIQNDVEDLESVLTHAGARFVFGLSSGAISIVKLAPVILSVIPRPLLKLVIGRVLRNEEKNGTGKYAPLRELIPAVRYDLKIILDRGGKVDLYKALGPEMLLMGGTKRPTYLKKALAALEKLLTRAQRIEFKGLDHSAAWNADRGGAPGQVAQCLRRFFTK